MGEDAGLQPETVGSVGPGPNGSKPPQQGIGGLQRPAAISSLRDRVPEPIVEGAKRAFEQLGEATARWRDLPDFLIIGTKKGGTTSMMSWLIAHPDVMRLVPGFQRRKSPHYFDLHYDRGEAWYRGHFPTSAARTLHARRHGHRPLLGEASPYYMFHPAAAARIHETAPQVRLIALLREPVARAYSNYWDRVATGHEELPSFEEALAAEDARLASVTADSLSPPGAYSYDHDHHAYLARGRYAEQLQPYLDLFGRDRMLVLPAEDMFRTPQGTFDRVQTFLGLRLQPVTLTPRNQRTGYPPIAPETKSRLEEYYRPHNARLCEMLGQDFGWR
jgi:hypothetical protein